ncbi:hypothetical protein WICPIJ_002934 [Wickerhamomyces pijperi]|uniref:Hpc2-related domain-containing protein n=1 Tax=Wickerhamomyces pijperi TaxID=599730 RepID=A0A9P8QAP6_WICPI|nr:hypothetical protein WICPIJ_002934 [Wickerhamomyces pijperi]
MTSNTTIAISSLLSPSKSNIEPAALEAKEIQTPADNSTPDQTSPLKAPLVAKTDSAETIVIDDDDDDLIILEDKPPPPPPPQPQLGKILPKPAKTISKSPSTAAASTSTTAATSTKKTPTSTTPTTENTEDSNSKSTEVKPKRKYVRKTPVDDKDTKPKPKAKPKPLKDTKTTQSSPIDGLSQTVTPESRASIEIQSLINEEKNSTVSTGTAETENGTGTGTDDKQPKTMPGVAKSTVTQKKQPEFNKDGTPRQRPGPKPGYKKKEKPLSEGPTSETKTDDDNAKVEVKKSSSSDSIEKVTDGDKDKVQSTKEKKPVKPKTAAVKDVKPIKPATSVKDIKPKKDKEEKPKPKKDTTASAKPKKDTTTQAKVKKDIKPKPTIAASKLAAATETTPAPESTYYEKMNKSLIQPNPLSKIPPPRIVEIASTRAVSPMERLDSLSDATKTKSIALNTTPSSLEEPPKRTEEPIIALHIPLTTSTEKSGSKQVIFNVMKMAEDAYGFNKVHPHSSRLHDLMNLEDDGMDIADDEDEPDEDEELEPEPKIDGRKSQKGKAKVGQYDYNDPFIDDTETLWEDQRASTKDGFFVFYGPLVEENLKIEKADNKVKRSRKRVANTSLAGSQAKKQNSSTTPTPQKPKVRSDLPTLAPKPSKQIAIAPAPASNSSKSGTTTPTLKPAAANNITTTRTNP